VAVHVTFVVAVHVTFVVAVHVTFIVAVYVQATACTATTNICAYSHYICHVHSHTHVTYSHYKCHMQSLVLIRG
jgi:hypothetical protein